MAARDPLFDDTSDDRPIDAHVGENRPRRGVFGRLFGRRERWTPPPGAGAPKKRSRWRRVGWALLVLLGLALLYYPVGMLVMHRIGDDPNFTAPAAKGESKAVAVAAALIKREVVDHRWTPNDPFIFPSWLLDNLPNFQVGIRDGLSRFAIEMMDKIGRTRGSSTVDKDLEAAAGRLKYSPYVWLWDLKVSIWPTAPTEDQYRAAMRAFQRYNKRLAAGKAVFDRRADNLQTFIDRVNADLGSDSAAIADRIEKHGGEFFDTKSDDLFYRTKGRIYAYYVLIKALGQDFKPLIDERNAQQVWDQMLHSLRQAAVLRPLIVRNGKPDSMLMPNHLAALGFYLLRARTQLKEVSEVLQK
jgi:hypothetical protein